MTYLLRSRAVEAFQVTNPINSAALSLFAGVLPTTDAMGRVAVVVPTAYGSVSVAEGGWVVKDPLGRLGGMTDAEFRMTCVLPDETPVPDASVPSQVVPFVPQTVPIADPAASPIPYTVGTVDQGGTTLV